MSIPQVPAEDSPRGNVESEIRHAAFHSSWYDGACHPSSEAAQYGTGYSPISPVTSEHRATHRRLEPRQPAPARRLQLLRAGSTILDPEDLPKVASSNPMVPADYPEPKRLHDFDTFSKRFEFRPDYFPRVKGDSIDLVGFRSGDVVAG